MRVANTFIPLFIFLLSLTTKAQDQKYYQLDTIHPVHDLKPYLFVLPEKDGSYELSQILSDTSLQFRPRENFPKNLDIGTTYWGKISFETQAALKGWELHFEDPRPKDIAWIRSNGKVDVYAVVNGKLLYHKKTGVGYPKTERDIPEKWILNRVNLDVPAHSKVSLYIRVKGNSFGWFPYFNPSLRKSAFQNYHPLFAFPTSFDIFVFGVTFIIFLYHFLQFLYLRQRIFFWFSLWLLLCTLTQAMAIGLDAEYLLGNTPSLRFPVWLLIPNSMLFTFWFFGREFANTRTKFPRLDKIILALPIIMIIAIVVSLLMAAVGTPAVMNKNISFHFQFIILYSFFGLILSVVLALQKDRFARYFGIGAVIATSFTLLGGLWSEGYIRLSFAPYTVGILLQTIAYSFGIAYRQQQLTITAQEQQLAMQESRNEMNRVKDLAEIKTRFFTNLSHEFRTPLTLILGPLNKAERNSPDEPKTALENKDFHLLKKNALRLQTLVDQLLDLSRLEGGQLQLQLERGKLIGFLRTLVYSFESLAERKNISLSTSFPEDLSQAWYDSDKLEKIMTNLLSNAFKYTPMGGAVSVSVQDDNDYLKIDIRDTGEGIETDELHKIFERFCRVEGSEEKGSGIGLALTKELVDLHNGTIRVQSNKGKGTSFTVRLPVSLKLLPVSGNQNSIKIEEVELNKEPLETDLLESQKQDDKPVVLVVEDNDDLRFYIKEILQDRFSLLSARDGLQGERMAIEHIPDIILSDVMMPGKDGYELCHSLKNNTKTSHIPIIMLTAKVGQTNKLEGLTQGADAYITKPFDEKELLLQMRNLIEARRKIWEHFKASDLLLIKDLKLTSMDDSFLHKVVEAIKGNLDNERFSVEDLSREVGFSRSQLHRKLKALMNKSANQLITEIRLNEAHHMLEHKAGSVSEIAYSVGYSNMSYFTKSFKDKFGILPSKV